MGSDSESKLEGETASHTNKEGENNPEEEVGGNKIPKNKNNSSKGTTRSGKVIS